MLIRKHQKQLILGLGLLSASFFSLSAQNDVDSYVGKVRAAIQSKFYGSDSFKGLSCALQLRLASDGLLISAIPNDNFKNDEVLCDALIGVAKLAIMPRPPSAEVYNAFNKSGSTIVFKP